MTQYTNRVYVQATSMDLVFLEHVNQIVKEIRNKGQSQKQKTK